MRVLVGACANIGDGGVPYGPIVDALRTLVRGLDPEELDAVVGSARPDLARLVPALGSADPSQAGAMTESLQPRLLDALLGFLQRLSGRAPVVFVIEDLHWADPATRETVAFLVRQLRSDRVLLIMTFRADELHRRHPLLPWLAEIGRSGQVERLDLVRLDAAQTRDLLAAIFDEPPAQDVVEQIHRRSDGNPFFVEELLMAGDGAGAGRLPPTLREVLLARIVAMPERAQAVIGIAAVAGRRVDHDLLARVAAMDGDELVESLRIAVGSQVLVAGSETGGNEGDYAFRHALLQEAAYDDLLPGERQRLHRAFAEALAERGPSTGAMAAGHWAELAHHWTAARDDRRAFDASIRAGEAAARAFAFGDAWRHDERALELWMSIDDPEVVAGIDRVALLDRAAVAAWLAGDSRRSVVLRREAVVALGPDADPIRVGTMLEQLGRALWTNGESEAAVAACEAALAVIPVDPPTAARARALSGYGQIQMLMDRWQESMALCEQAVAMAREVGARQVEGHALNTLGLDLAVAGRGAEAIAALEEALAIAKEAANADDIGRGYVNLGEAWMNLGRTDRAAESVREGITVTDQIGVARTYGEFVRANGIQYAYELGAWDEAARLADDSIAMQATGPAQRRRYGLTRWLPLLVGQGDERAPSLVDELGVLLEGYPVEAQFNSPFRLAVAEAALWRGDPETAMATILDGIREVEDRDWPTFHLRLFRMGFGAAADLAEVARARRDPSGEQAAIEAGAGLWASLSRSSPGCARASKARPGRDRCRGRDDRRGTGRLVHDSGCRAACSRRRPMGGARQPYFEAYGRWRQARSAPRRRRQDRRRDRAGGGASHRRQAGRQTPAFGR
jgi:tetratricopeptide (TPR) repeat protein